MFLWNYLITKLTGSVVWRDVHLLGNNIFLSIAMWVSMIWSIDTVKNYWKTDRKKSILFLLITIIIALASFFTEASIYGFAMFLVFYFWYWNKKRLSILYIILCIGVFFLSSTRVCNFVHEYTMGNDFSLTFDAFIQLTKREVQLEIFILCILSSSFMDFVLPFRILQIKKSWKIFQDFFISSLLQM